MELDFDAIKSLIEVSEKCDLSELLIEYEGVKIEIKRERKTDGVLFSHIPQKSVMHPPAMPVITGGEAFLHNAEKPAGSGSAAVSEEENKYYKVLSPLVGVFYRAPWPGAKDFVEVGERVETGQTLCIVEAMKLMNEISAEVSGKIVKILAKNEEVVQCDQPLFLIDPD